MNLKNCDLIISQALEEDATDQDITTNGLVPKNHTSEAYILVQQAAMICGTDIVRKIFQKLDKNIQFQALAKDGDYVQKNTQIASIKGNTRALLTTERTALNFLSYLSGVATQTHTFVKKIHPLKTKIMDTRKTTPGLRELEKYAVRCGGGKSHRTNLSEMVLIKDNHLQVCYPQLSIQEAIDTLRQKTKKYIEIEVDDLIQFKDALNANPDIILLDNMSSHQMKQAVVLTKKLPKGQRPLLEASGGITLKNVRAAAKTGVDRISIGALTHSHQAVDVSMVIQ